MFQADEVFHETSTQKDVYERVGKPIEEDVVAGFSCVIFAYGQTGTGKTHTMEGDLKNRSDMAGLIPRMYVVCLRLTHCLIYSHTICKHTQVQLHLRATSYLCGEFHTSCDCCGALQRAISRPHRSVVSQSR